MNKINHNDVTKELQHLGLTEYEARIYIAVLESGEASAGHILDKVGLHREQVYRALRRLVNQGLITKYTKRKRSYFTPINPGVLVERMNAKLELAKSLQPLLKNLHEERSQIIQVSEGPAAYQSLHEDQARIPSGTEILVLGGVGETYYELTKSYLASFHRKLKKRGIRIRIIDFEDNRYDRELSTGSFIEVRNMPKIPIGPVSTAIYEDKIVFEIFDPEEPENFAMITVKNQKIADAYRATFEAFWKIADRYR